MGGTSDSIHNSLAIVLFEFQTGLLPVRFMKDENVETELIVITLSCRTKLTHLAKLA